MKAIVCLMCLVVVAAKPFRGRYVMTYDNSLENGRYDTSLEWMPSAVMTKSKTQRVQDLTHLLNSGYIDRSDEYQIRRIINNPTAYSNRPYFVDYSGEVHFLAPGVGGAFGGGVPAAGGSGVHAAKK